jgi:hypothetical protein
MSIISDANMAWMLADAANVCLTGHERTMTFVELGCGEHHLAIERILNAVKSNRMMLPVAIFDRLTRWLDGYAGSPEEPQPRAMLAEIRAQQFQPVPPPDRRSVTMYGAPRRLRAALASPDEGTVGSTGPLRHDHPGESATRAMTTHPDSRQGRPMAAPVGHPADSGSLLASRDSELSARFVNDVLLPTAAALAIFRFSRHPAVSTATR